MRSVTGPHLSLQVDNRHTTGPPFTAPSRDITTLVEPYIVKWRARSAIIAVQRRRSLSSPPQTVLELPPPSYSTPRSEIQSQPARPTSARSDFLDPNACNELYDRDNVVTCTCRAACRRNEKSSFYRVL